MREVLGLLSSKHSSAPHNHRPAYSPDKVIKAGLKLKQFENKGKSEKTEEQKKGIFASFCMKKAKEEKKNQKEEEEGTVVREEKGLSVKMDENSVLGGFIHINHVPYVSPDTDLLTDYSDGLVGADEVTKEQGYTIEKMFSEYKIQVKLSGIEKGPALTMYEYELLPGTQISKVTAREDEICYVLGGKKIRILAPIPRKKAIGVEVPNDSIEVVGFKEVISELSSTARLKQMNIPMILGKTVTGDCSAIDVANMPHMLIAGTTGSGKSVCINSFINSILYLKSPEEVRLIMVDPKLVELSIYDGIPHLLAPVITEGEKVSKAFDYLILEMERRYKFLAKYKVRSIVDYNEMVDDGDIKSAKMPFIVMIIDEFADLMAVIGKEIDSAISRISAKARAVGIHLILATQRPSSDVITGTIKANLPGRIAFAVSSKINSRIILDESGAESLIGKGDMLLLDPSKMYLQRIQGAYVSGKEVGKVVRAITAKNSCIQQLSF